MISYMAILPLMSARQKKYEQWVVGVTEYYLILNRMKMGLNFRVTAAADLWSNEVSLMRDNQEGWVSIA